MSVHREAWKFGLGLALACGLAAIGLHWMVSEIVPPLPFSGNRPPMFWETLRVPVLFCAYLGMGIAIAGFALSKTQVSNWSVPGLVAAALGLAMAVRWATPDMALDFAPRPDALHYSALAARVVSAGQWTVPVGPHELPSRFSPATSLLLAATQWLRPDHLGMGIWMIWISGGLALALLGGVGTRAFSKRIGAVAALLLASSPAYGHYTRQLMSEVPWSLAILLALACIYLARDRWGVLFSGGFLLASGLLFKPPHVAVVAGVGASYLIQMVVRPERRWRNAFAVGLGFVAGLLPWLIYNRLVLGDWITSGYQIFDSNRYAVDAVFGWRYLFGPPIEKGALGNLLYYPLAALGLDPRMSRMLFALPVALLVLAGGAYRLKLRIRSAPPSAEARSLLVGAGGALLVYLGMFLLYYYQDTRFWLPVLPLICLLAAVWIDPFIGRLGPNVQRLALGAMILVLASMGAAILQVENEGRRLHNYAVWNRLSAVLEPYAVLVTDEDPVALGFYRLWTAERPVVPALPAGTDWYEADPLATRRRTGTFQIPYGGLENALKPHLDAGRKIAVWLVNPRTHLALFDCLPPGYQLKPWTADIPNGFELVRVPPAPTDGVP